MSNNIEVKLTKQGNVLLQEVEKARCFFVGKPGQATSAYFEKGFEITHSEWPKNVHAEYQIGERKFNNFSCANGKTITRVKGTYRLKKHPDGTMYLSMKVDYPAYDSYDKMYSETFERVIYRENGEVVVLQAKYGYVLPKINVYVGIKESVPELDELLKVLDNAGAYEPTLLKKYALCLALKYRFSEEQAELLENFILYTCLDAGNTTASFGIFKSRKRSLSYEFLKVLADFICGVCFSDWYRTAPARRYNELGELTDYARRLQQRISVVWNNNERAYCHFVRHDFDAQVFADVYGVAIVLLKFLAENEVGDLDSLKRQAAAPGIISSTLMADAADGLSHAQLSSEVKKQFFALLGTNPQKAKEKTEKAMYRLHAEINSLFKAGQAVSIYAQSVNSPEQNAPESAVEKTVLTASAKVALKVKKQQNDDGVNDCIAAMCRSIAAQHGISLGEDAACKALSDLADSYLEEETDRMRIACRLRSYEYFGEFLPENYFIRVYLIAYLLLHFIWSAGGDGEALRQLLQQPQGENKWLKREQLNDLISEAKYRFGAMCGTNLLESMAEK